MTFPVYPIPEERAIRDQLADLSYAQRQILEPVRDALSGALDTTHSGQEKLLGTLSRRALTQATRLRHEQRAALAPLARDAELQVAIAHDEQRRLTGNLPPLPREDFRGVSLAGAQGGAFSIPSHIAGGSSAWGPDRCAIPLDAPPGTTETQLYRFYHIGPTPDGRGGLMVQCRPGEQGPAKYLQCFSMLSSWDAAQSGLCGPPNRCISCSEYNQSVGNGEPSFIEAPVPPIGGLEGPGPGIPQPPVGGQIEQQPAQTCPPCAPGETEQRQRYKLCQHDTRKTDCRIINAEECCPRDYAEKAESDDRQTLQMLLECLCKRAVEEMSPPEVIEIPPESIGGLEGIGPRIKPSKSLCETPLFWPLPEETTDVAAITDGFAIPQP